ncbi:MAG: DUF1289 domain-containing protein [Novosphingobium sp.]
MEEPASPCNTICRINRKTGWCEGCCRTLDEIAAWSTASGEEKRAILRALELRRPSNQ